MYFIADPLLSQLAPLALKTVLGAIFAGLLGVIMWPFRKARKEWITLKEEQSKIHSELVQQRTNCLTTLQQSNQQQVKLLEKAVDILEGVRLDLKEQTGYLKASSVPRRLSARKRKH